MRTLTLCQHISLDGFLARPGGELDWVRLDDELFEFVGTLTARSDTALYGRATWDIMEAYWPTAAGKPDATKHDREHSAWYGAVDKVVMSRSMAGKDTGKTRFTGDRAEEAVRTLKDGPGRGILMLGRPSAAQALTAAGLVDEYWLFLNPVILGRGIPASDRLSEKVDLHLVSTRPFRCGAVGMQYVRER